MTAYNQMIAKFEGQYGAEGAYAFEALCLTEEQALAMPESELDMKVRTALQDMEPEPAPAPKTASVRSQVENAMRLADTGDMRGIHNICSKIFDELAVQKAAPRKPTENEIMVARMRRARGMSYDAAVLGE